MLTLHGRGIAGSGGRVARQIKEVALVARKEGSLVEREREIHLNQILREEGRK